MVFSQTSHKTLSSLKLEIDRSELRDQEDGRVGGVIVQGETSLPPATTSCSEGYLKPEPLFEAKMFHDTDSEFFQDLVQWCSTPAKEEQVQTIDSPKVLEQRALNTDTLHTPFSPQGWEAPGVISPPAHASFYTNTPKDPLSPSGEIPMQFIYPNEDQPLLQDQFLDINSLPVVIGDLAPEKTVDMNPWYMESVDFNNTHDTYFKTSTQINGPFIDQEDSLNMKLLSVIPREVESNDVVVSEYVINDHSQEASVRQGRHKGLFLDVAARDPAWSGDVISTPDVLSFVEQLETENCKSSIKQSPEYEQDTITDTRVSTPAAPEYEPITPQSHQESHHDSEEESKPLKRRGHYSEDSDATYTPYIEETPRKYKRRKPNVPIKEMILALEGSQQLTKARRGRPPKRRESTVSSACSIDETCSSVSTHEYKYRELRDKNNEASKRSRMHRKLKELQMEQLADELEERNKKLQIRANVLEDMTKKLKDALMTAILDKK